ncbi:DNA-(apurinic or apyrimidinic site) lyase 2 [Pyrus ussuriensis x Pyrus communis]|uniref:DNA-(Apurinic or apyrimidinic site) lyase 2 n=1 Tax=Pyrus ussuriensis x Pyrus communis TaxID=2448454 RepID=A0A5N5GBF9_9ROSA|nr:DNA-(apurinic or apyrimidinic site) lyase 2 [Pyrus ussuriensis x Pyrus communis]
MKIVKYNVNGLKLLNLLDRLTGNQTATAGIDRRPGHGKGLRVLLQPHLRKRLHRSTLSGDEVALPVAAKEAFTGVLDRGKGQMNAVAEGLKEFSRDDLLTLMPRGGVL